MASLTSCSDAVAYHSKWILVKYVESTPYRSDDREPEHFETITVFLPEYVVRQVPHYALKLDTELAKPNYNQNVLITIEDDYMHNKLIYNYAIQFLASGFLPDLGGNAPTCAETLENLFDLEEFSVQMDVETLKLAATKQIEELNGITLPVFLEFARNYYSHNEDTREDSFAPFVKKKLAKFTPQIIEHKMVQNVQKDGKLGQQFVEVLAEFYTGHKAAVKRKAVEISDDELEPVEQELYED